MEQSLTATTQVDTTTTTACVSVDHTETTAALDSESIHAAGSGRTVTYRAPGAQKCEVAAESGPTTTAAKASQFLPQNGHRSETAWQFWYYQRQTPFYTQAQQQTIDGITRIGAQPKPEKSALESQSYRDQLKPLGKMPTLEHFFNYYVHMKKPSEMPREIDIHFFRENLVPMWEDSPEGGILIIKIKKDDNIDKMWESILFAMMGKSISALFDWLAKPTTKMLSDP